FLGGTFAAFATLGIAFGTGFRAAFAAFAVGLGAGLRFARVARFRIAGLVVAGLGFALGALGFLAAVTRFAFGILPRLLFARVLGLAGRLASLAFLVFTFQVGGLAPLAFAVLVEIFVD